MNILTEEELVKNKFETDLCQSKNLIKVSDSLAQLEKKMMEIIISTKKELENQFSKQLRTKMDSNECYTIYKKKVDQNSFDSLLNSVSELQKFQVVSCHFITKEETKSLLELKLKEYASFESQKLLDLDLRKSVKELEEKIFNYTDEVNKKIAESFTKFSKIFIQNSENKKGELKPENLKFTNEANIIPDKFLGDIKNSAVVLSDYNCK